MRQTNIDLDDSLALGPIDLDVASGIAKLGEDYVRVVHVVAARSYTVPLDMKVTSEDALRLAAAVIEWDCGMMDAADSPFSGAAPKLSSKQIIRSFLPKMYPCELRDLYVDMHGYAGTLR